MRITVANEPVQPVFSDLEARLEREGRSIREQLKRMGLA